MRNLQPSVDGSFKLSDTEQSQINEDMKYIVYVARQLNQMNEVMFQAAFERDDPKIKAAAMLIACKYKDKYISDLIERITDDDIIVNQCARHSLIQISNLYVGGRSYVDFGPLAHHSSTTKNATSILWKVWFDQAQKNKKTSQPYQNGQIKKK